MKSFSFIDFQSIVEVARGLQELREKMVFVGGAVLGFYVDDPAAEELRPTFDIDLTIELTGLSNWAHLQERLIQLGFFPDMSEQVICRYLFKQITVDIMLAEDSPFGVSTPWYKPAFPFAETHTIAPGLSIRLFPVAYMLATKFAAFTGRGKDPRSSHDFEDIIFLTNNRVHLVNEILTAHADVRHFLQVAYNHIWQNPNRDEILSCHFVPTEVDLRLPFVLEKIRQIAQG